MRDIHIALQFGNIKHFNEGLSEFSRQLALQYAAQARQLKEERRWHFHFILPKQWHGLFGDEVTYHELTDRMRWRHHFDVPLDVWHGLHQHMRYRPPVNSRHKVITVHDLNYVYAKKGLSLWWQTRRLHQKLKQANKIIAISQFTRQDIQKHFSFKGKIEVIYNGAADLRGVEKIPPSSSLKHKKYLFHVSRMSPAKNVESLLALAKYWPSQNFVFAGPESPEIERHRHFVQENSLENVSIFPDVTEQQKAWLYENCEAFLFPSLAEGFGLPPIEAMFFPIPVIVSNLTSLPEICGDGAKYWADFNPASMKITVEQAIQNFIPEDHAPPIRYNWVSAGKNYLQSYSLGLINQKSSGKP